MATRWHRTRGAKRNPAAAGQVHTDSLGSMSVARLLELAAAGVLAPTDLLSMEGADVEITVERFVALAHGERPPVGKSAGAPMPSWLADVIEAEAKAPAKPPPVALDWLADVARTEAVRVVPPVVPDWLSDVASAPPARSPAAPAIPMDWLEDIRQIEESLPLRLPSLVAAKPTLLLTSPAAVPPKPAAADRTQASPPTAVPPPPAPMVPGPESPSAAAVPQPAARLAPPTQLVPVRATLAEVAPPSPEQMGCDPQTGRVLDVEAHTRWQEAEALRRQQELDRRPTLSVAETFMEAQHLLQEWVDADENKPLVVGADLAAVVNAPTLLLLLQRYDGYGPMMREKLLKRLTSFVENRKKFFQAFS